MSRNEIESLLEKYLCGTILPEEAERLRQLSNLCGDEELNYFFSKQWEAYSPAAVIEMPEIQQISETLYQKLQATKKNTFIGFWMRAAAILLLVLTTGLSAYLLVDNREMAMLGEREVIVRVEKGQRVGLTLPDGSSVLLNSESLLSYRQDFGQQDREVKFAGEGYFEITKNPEKKFTVKTQFMNVEVLGTAFNFYAYESKEEVELTLVEGKVFLCTNTQPEQTATLEPDSKAVYNKTTGKLKVEPTNTFFETAWQAKELVFRSEPLAEVLQKVERRYGVVIHVDKEELLRETYTGVFDKEELSKVMEILGLHFGFDYRLKEDTVLIKARK